MSLRRNYKPTASSSPSLEELLRRAVNGGVLNHISLFPDAKNPRLWCVVFRDVLGFQPARYFYHADPVEVMRQALLDSIKSDRIDRYDDIV